MEEEKNIDSILELVDAPAFCVRDGKVLRCNHAARHLFIEPEQQIAPLLGSYQTEYQNYGGGALYLTLQLSQVPLGVCITRLEGFDLFVAEQEAEQSGLQALSLAAIYFREPLSDIIATVDQVLSGNADHDPAIQKQLAQLDRSLFRLQRLVCNMSDAARGNAPQPSRMSVMNICATMAELLERIGGLLQEQGIKLDISLPHGPVMALVDGDLLERAVYNMISNAVKVTAQGGTVEVALTQRDQQLLLSIRDHGPGIPQSKLGTVYTRFRRQPGLEDHPDGIGLGMTLIRQAAVAHGGTVLIDRPEGGGTRITMGFPIRLPDPKDGLLRSDRMRFDYAGERDHGLLELSDVLPLDLYKKDL